MQKVSTNKPLLIMLYGYPGAGKTHFARELTSAINCAHLQGDKIRHELFDTPKYDSNEDNIIDHLMRYMAEEFMSAGLSVVYDFNASRQSQRRSLRELARKSNGSSLLVWLQIDTDSAISRLSNRDKRKNDDKYAAEYNSSSFKDFAGKMQNPSNEDYMVISGKHTFNTQKGAVMKKLYDMGLITLNTAGANVIKPGLVNLIPNPAAGRVDMSRRNIIIR
jgi:predicted kinase